MNCSSASSSRSLRSSKHLRSPQEAAYSGTPLPKRARTPFEVFVDQELISLLNHQEFSISKEVVDSIHDGLMKRWQTMSKEEMRLYEDLVLAASLDSDYAGIVRSSLAQKEDNAVADHTAPNHVALSLSRSVCFLAGASGPPR